mgnify:FL=1
MKRYVITGIASLNILLFIGLWIMGSKYNSMKLKWENAENNVRAYSEQLSSAQGSNKAFKLTIDQLKYFNDSIFQRLDETRKELKVKDNKLRSLQYIASDFARKDTIVFRDTLFRDNQIYIDTLLADAWYSVKVGMEYPSTVVVQPRFKSEKHIVVSARKETVNPPKRFFLWRWLQKKQWVVQVDVVEKNPYVQNQSNRYVEIVK